MTDAPAKAGERCPYCGNNSERVTGARIYPHRPDLFHKTFYACFPCGAWVGCHPNSTQALGRLADAELRAAKSRAHAAFDPIWRERVGKKIGRSEAYRWLANALGIPDDECHIGMFDSAMCARVADLCRSDLAAIRKDIRADRKVRAPLPAARDAAMKEGA